MLTEVINLPSQGNLYPKDHSLSSGQIEIKYMTAREEDILTTQSYIENNVVIEKLLDSIIVSDDVDPMDLTIGDRERVLLETRILGYGSEYKIKHNGKEHTINLRDIKNSGDPSKFDNTPFVDYHLELSDKIVTCKIPNGHDINKLKEEIKMLEKSGSPVGIVSTRLAHAIVAIDGKEDGTDIRQLSKDMPARDSMNLRLFLKRITPDVDLRIQVGGEEVELPMGANFFYPSTEV